MAFMQRSSAEFSRKRPRNGQFCLLFGLLVGLTVFHAGARAAASDPVTFELPIQKFASLPGKVIGVLASNNQSLLAQEGRKGPADALTFGVGSGSQQWLYLPNQKKPQIGALRIPIGEDGKRFHRYDRLSFATLRLLDSAGITKPYTLVEVEVNGGLGSPSSPTFVATAIRPIEGTKRYPLQVDEVMTKLQEHFQTWKAGQDSALAGALASERKRLGWTAKKGTKRSENVVQYVTWLPERMMLQVQLRVVLQEEDPLFAPSKPEAAYEGEDGAPPDRKASRTVGVESGLGYEIDREGKLDRMEKIPLRSFHRTLAPQGS